MNGQRAHVLQQPVDAQLEVGPVSNDSKRAERINQGQCAACVGYVLVKVVNISQLTCSKQKKNILGRMEGR